MKNLAQMLSKAPWKIAQGLDANEISRTGWEDPRRMLEHIERELGYLADKLKAVVTGDITAQELDLNYLYSNAVNLQRRLQDLKTALGTGAINVPAPEADPLREPGGTFGPPTT